MPLDRIIMIAANLHHHLAPWGYSNPSNFHHNRVPIVDPATSFKRPSPPQLNGSPSVHHPHVHHLAIPWHPSPHIPRKAQPSKNATNRTTTNNAPTTFYPSFPLLLLSIFSPSLPPTSLSHSFDPFFPSHPIFHTSHSFTNPGPESKANNNDAPHHPLLRAQRPSRQVHGPSLRRLRQHDLGQRDGRPAMAHSLV